MASRSIRNPKSKTQNRPWWGKLALGGGRQPRRSRRLRMYEQAATARATPAAGDGIALPGWRRWAWGAGGVALVALLLYVAFGTTWFYIYDIEVEGATLLTKEELYNRSNLEALSIFWLNPRDVARRLEAEPLVEQASVSAIFPNRARVRIQERVPVAVWQSGERSLFVDEGGALFDLRGDASTMLSIRDLRGQPAEAGATVDAVAVRTASELATLMPERIAYDWEPGVGLSFVTDGEWRVTFGDYTRLPAKVAAYHAFRAQIQSEQKILLLDLSVPEHPYYRVAP